MGDGRDLLMAPNVFFLFDSIMVPAQDRPGEGNVQSPVSQVTRTCSEGQAPVLLQDEGSRS